MEVRLLQVLLEIDLVGLAEDLPIDMADIIAGDIGAMLGELDADSLIGRAVHAGHQTFDDLPGAKVQGTESARAYAGQDTLR